MRDSLRETLLRRGYSVRSAADGPTGLAMLREEDVDAVICDLRMNGMGGLEVCEKIAAAGGPSPPVILITAFGSVETAVKAMKLGAFDYLTKPFKTDELQVVIERALRHGRILRENQFLRSELEGSPERFAIIGSSPAIRKTLEMVDRYAGSSATVLIRGESGTGKELVARAIHDLSERAQAPFMDLNCSSFSEVLLENELFGHEKGAYTDAAQTKLGLVEMTDGGTLFLDEVADMPELVQAKLLRFLDSRKFKRVGGTRDLDVDIRVVAASNKHMPEEIQAGRFREDLYYRLKVLSIHLPPLRERGEDVILLTHHFLDFFSQRLKKRFDRVSPEAARAILGHTWPGNVRELRNVVERAVLLEDGPALELRHLPRELAREDRAPRFREGCIPSLQEVEDQHVLRVLGYTQDNKSQAARLLGISRQSLLDRLKRLERDRASALSAID